MINFESIVRKNGFVNIAGLDEVGRGPLAGPVVAAAVILPDPVPEFLLLNIKDSKKLSEKKRIFLDGLIKSEALSYAIGTVDECFIDEVNILEATKIAMKNAIDSLKLKPDYLLIDGNFKLPGFSNQQSIVRGDQKSVSIAAASILAKVFRDNLMYNYHDVYPEYNFKSNKGYGTREHCNVIASIGPSKIHRKTFKRVLEYL